MEQSSLKQDFLTSFDTYSDAIFRFCLVKTSNKELAEDLVQETFMRYWQSLSSGKEMRNTRSLLYTIANHLVIDWYRKKRSLSLDALGDDGFDPPEERGSTSEEDAELKGILQVIDDLEEKDREVLLLRYVEGLDPKDIAQITGDTTNVVSVRIHRAIEKVQKKLHI